MKRDTKELIMVAALIVITAAQAAVTLWPLFRL